MLSSEQLTIISSSSQQYLNYPNFILRYIYLDYILHSHTLLQRQQELHQMDHLLTLSLFVSSHTGFHSTRSFSPFLTVMNFPINTTIWWENMQSRLFCCLFPFKLAVATVCELDRWAYHSSGTKAWLDGRKLIAARPGPLAPLFLKRKPDKLFGQCTSTPTLGSPRATF